MTSRSFQMALIPGSYARAAGLQSEINKVTVTRVAGSEVQFRRTIDTYQRDLRYNVNHIGREQRLLKRSLRRYSKKLLDSKKDRQQRQVKEKEQSEKKKQNVKKIQEAEQALKRTALSVRPSDVSSSPENNQLDVSQTNSDNAFVTGQPPSTLSTLSESPDSGVGSETEDTSSPESTDEQVHDISGKTRPQQTDKAFLTSGRNKPPYLAARRGHRKTNQEDRHTHQGKDSCTQDCINVSTLLTNNEELLPIIAEENEDGTDQLKVPSAKSSSAEAGDQLQEQSDECPVDCGKNGNDSQMTSTVKTLPPVVTCLDTKSVCHPKKPNKDEAPSAQPDNIHKTKEHQGVNTEHSGATVTKKKPRRRTGISYGDLIKLQHTHTSSTKQLFKLVDRLASVHGIVVPRHPSTPSSLDPRNNVKIKRRSRGSLTSDGIVKQAAVLYPMKYGYNLPDQGPEDATPPVPEILGDPTKDRHGEGAGCVHCNGRKSLPRMPDVPSDPARQSTLSVRRGSIDVTSPFYEFHEAAASIFDDLILDRVSPPAPTSERRNKNNKPLTMAEVSAQATKIRKRTLLGPVSEKSTEFVDSNEIQRKRGIHKLESDMAVEESMMGYPRDRRRSLVLLPVPRQSRSLADRRRHSVEDQLQRRLNDGGEVGQMAWHSAFGRLKMIHTLYDLSQHFSKNTT
ncbi:uncharacterized protein LOC143282474 [Babylonia areolata]|uniref:uncharacterized protein LOC143282474 n=1 Tax=Babylonia areolata TaxID=304850 RepID=UPI003FD16936